MAPCPKPPTTLQHEAEEPTPKPEQLQIVKKNLLTFGYGHLAAFYGLYLCFTSAHWGTVFFAFILYATAVIGITAGAHRLWAHRTYKATVPLQILLMLMNTLAFQNTVVTWVRDHRLHHKYSDTESDPHNASRGFFYSHIGWLLVKKNSSVRRNGRAIDMRDIHSNPVLMFQQKYAVPFICTICFILPTIIPMYFWGESLNTAYHVTIFRYIFNLHITFSVNSVAHLWGTKPYDKAIQPAQNIPVSILAFGEGFHNYHHVFPWDYRTAELGNNRLNLSTKFIDFFARIGWAYDLKSAPDGMVRARMSRTGDGTNLWGWGDEDMEDEMRDGAVVWNKVD